MGEEETHLSRAPLPFFPFQAFSSFTLCFAASPAACALSEALLDESLACSLLQKKSADRREGRGRDAGRGRTWPPSGRPA